VLIVGLLVIAATIAWRGWLVHNYSGDLTARLYYPFDERMDGIMWGCVLACLLHEPSLYQLAQRVFRRRWLPVIGGGAVAITAAVFMENDSFVRYLLLPAGVAVVIGAAVMQPGNLLLRPMHWKPLRYIGRISYGMYVLHPLAITAAGLVIDDESLGLRLLAMATACALTVAIAAASYRWCETPFLHLKHRLTVGPRTQQGGGRVAVGA